MDVFDKRLLEAMRGPKPVYVEGAEPVPATCDECGQTIPGAYEEPLHVADCPCGSCRVMRRLRSPRTLLVFSEFDKKGKTITFRKLDPVYRVEY